MYEPTHTFKKYLVRIFWRKSPTVKWICRCCDLFIITVINRGTIILNKFNKLFEKERITSK